MDPTETIPGTNGRSDDFAPTGEGAAAETVTLPEPTATFRTPTGQPAVGGGRFEVQYFLAAGGLGRVSVAIDRELNRRVALKEILPERADDPESRAMLVQEAEITGKLEHPGVVPVYGLGCDALGRPLYAMRLIHGTDLKTAVATLHAPGLPEADRRRQFRELLRRFADVCLTIAYAHGRGVIHRDLKPSNILLGDYGETLVVDWGLAKPVGHPEGAGRSAGETVRPASPSPSETEAGEVKGTLAYMSPEQARGEVVAVGPASDVYGLGATLYSVLTGASPIPRGSKTSMLARAARSEFPRPREVDRRVPAALEAVCLKALEARQEDRYPSARALADDLRRWLDDEPVSVFRDPFRERAWRWARRHRTAVTAALVLLSTAAVGSAWHAARIAAAQARTETARAAARAQFDRARGLVDHMLDWVEVPSLAYAAGVEESRLRISGEAADAYRGFVATYPREPSVRRGAARAYRTAARVRNLNGLAGEAAALYRAAAALLAGLADGPRADRDPLDPYELARTLIELGEVHRMAGRLAEAESAYRDGLDRLGPARDDTALRDAIARVPTPAGPPPDPRLVEAEAAINQGAVRLERGHDREARDACALAVDRLVPFTGPGATGDGRANPLFLVMARVGLAAACRRTGEADRARSEIDAALRLLAAPAANRANSDAGYLDALARQERALQLAAAGSRTEALADLDRAVTRLAALAKAKPKLAFYRQGLAEALVDRAEARREPGREAPKKSVDDTEAACRILEGLIKESPDRPVYRSNLARALATLGRYESARQGRKAADVHFSRAVALLATNLRADPSRRSDAALSEAILDDLSRPAVSTPGGAGSPPP